MESWSLQWEEHPWNKMDDFPAMFDQKLTKNPAMDTYGYICGLPYAQCLVHDPCYFTAIFGAEMH